MIDTTPAIAYRLVALDRMTIQAFAEQHGLEMVVTERPLWAQREGVSRYYAVFDGAETRAGRCMLAGTHGDGATPEEAIAAYADAISGQLLVVDAYTPERREIPVPVLSLVTTGDQPGEVG